jgi:hypothetical protein
MWRSSSLAVAFLATVGTATLSAQPASKALVLEPMHPEVTTRHAMIAGHLQPSAQAWVTQQARAEAARAKPDIAATENAVRSHFGGQGLSRGDDIEEMVFVLLAEAAQDIDSDLRAQMAALQQIDNQKNAVRDLMAEANQLLVANIHQPAVMACNTPPCAAFRQHLGAVTAMGHASGHPVRASLTGPLTNNSIAQIRSALASDQASLSDISTQSQMALQQTMDRRSQFMAVLSNLLKKTSDTQSAIISNLK